MNKQEMAEQLRCRVEEIDELEDCVQSYAGKIKGVAPLLRANMLTAYRNGLIDCMHYLDLKAQNIALKRKMGDSFRGD